MDEKYHMCHQNIALIWTLEYHFFHRNKMASTYLKYFYLQHHILKLNMIKVAL